MKKTKRKLDEITKFKLIYSGELLIFSVVFLVLGSLILSRIISLSDIKKTIFTWVTLFGGFFNLGDFIYALASKKRRKKVSLLDKSMGLPVSLSLIGVDIYALSTPNLPVEYYIYSMGTVFICLSAIYIFQGIYHFYFPIPGILEDETENKKKENVPSKEDETLSNVIEVDSEVKAEETKEN